MKYSVTVTLTAVQTIEVEADDEEEACASARDLFDLGEADIEEIETEFIELN
jgi:hypothetical protein